jgi:ComF family protein
VWLDALLELVAPTRCAGCDLPGALLCDACEAALPRIAAEQACPRCGAPFGCIVCTECWDSEHAFAAAVALGELEPPLARAVVLHKDAGERRLGVLLGSLLAERVAAIWPGWADVVVAVPPTRAAIARRGFDHAAALALPVAERLGVSLEALLTRPSAHDQRALGRDARKRAAAGSFSATDAPARVLVVDDVLTTGATLDAASEALLAAGAREVRAAVVARAW